MHCRLMAAKRGRKANGSAYERELARQLQALGFPAYRTPLSGAGVEKGDISGVPGHHCEAKRQENVSLWQAFEQARSQCPPDRVPVVFSRKNRGRTIIAKQRADAGPLDALHVLTVRKGQQDPFAALTAASLVASQLKREPALLLDDGYHEAWVVRYMLPDGWRMLGDPPNAPATLF
jgi:Holliday junction resolvase